MLTYFVVQSFEIGARGILVADAPLQMQSAGQAIRAAERLAERKVGVIAFSRTGDMDSGEFEDAKILFSAGRVMHEMEETEYMDTVAA